MHCEVCNAELPVQSAYCSKCGARVAGGPAPAEQRRRYPLWRVGILTFVSLSLYFPYWMYVSWKQSATELPEKTFYPGWHAFSQFVPVYNVIVLFQHFHTIETIQMRNGTLSNINLGLLTFVIIVEYGFLAIGYAIGGVYFIPLVLIFIFPLVATGIVVWGQANLNRYWERAYAPIQSAATGPGEIIITASGVTIVLGIVLITVSALTGPTSIASVSQVSSINSMTVGETSPSLGTISDSRDAVGYSFLAREGDRYIIEVGPAHVGEILVHALVTLWDSNGTTLIRTKTARIHDGYYETPIVLRWLAPSTGTRYVTVEPGGPYSGAFVIRVYPSPR